MFDAAFWIDVYRARINDYACKVDQYRQIAERAGYTSDHPLVAEIAARAAEMKLEIPAIEIPAFDIKAPEIPSPTHFPELPGSH